jgi:membrane-bound metal-dependent hydrolase YbcI (DUF457 family)
MLTFPTHFLIGAALSYLFGFSMLWGALGGMAPDLDGFTPWHRGPFHSIVFALVMVAAVYALTRSRRKSVGAGIGFAAHVLTDWLDYGTLMLAWPVLPGAYSLDTVIWYDPVTNAVLSAASILTILLLKKHREKKPWGETIKNLLRK